MSALAHKFVTIACDGCRAIHGDPGQYPDVAQARLGAIAAGWRLIPKVNRRGLSTQVPEPNPEALTRAGRMTSDACPACRTMKPQPLNHGGRR